MSDTPIPERYVQLCRDIGKLCKSAGLSRFGASFTPGSWRMGDEPRWGSQIQMVWDSGRHGDGADRIVLTSTVDVHTTIKDGETP